MPDSQSLHWSSTKSLTSRQFLFRWDHKRTTFPYRPLSSNSLIVDFPNFPNQTNFAIGRILLIVALLYHSVSVINQLIIHHHHFLAWSHHRALPSPDLHRRVLRFRQESAYAWLPITDCRQFLESNAGKYGGQNIRKLIVDTVSASSTLHFIIAGLIIAGRIAAEYHYCDIKLNVLGTQQLTMKSLSAFIKTHALYHCILVLDSSALSTFSVFTDIVPPSHPDFWLIYQLL